MKTKVLLVFSLFLLARISTAQYVTIPDANFRYFLQQSYPTCFNSQDMMDTTCSAVLTARTMNCAVRQIANLQGIQYFKGLDTLDCNYNQFTSLPALPSGLKVLNCSYNKLTSLPALPSALTKLVCEGNQLTSLPALPSGLMFLDCYGNQLTSLPALPSGLTALGCSNNQLTSLPALPSGLRYLNYSNCPLISLSTLPSGLTSLDCSHNQLTRLLALPSGLTTLNCSGNQLTSLQTLPSGLTALDCNFNQLTSLPSLPSSLKYLSCRENQLISLPALPSLLDTLGCSHNKLTSLPALPSSLDTLSCEGNRLISLPALPSSLKYLFCYSNQLTSLPVLPSGLRVLLSDYNPNLSCLPNLPSGLHWFGISNTQITCLPNKPAGLTWITLPICTDPAKVCNGYATLTGKVYLDTNNNNQYDNNEKILPNFILSTQPSNSLNPQFLSTSTGYSFVIDALVRSVNITNSYPQAFTVPVSSYSFTPTQGQTLVYNFGVRVANPNYNDLESVVAPFVARPGFTSGIVGTVRNVGGTNPMPTVVMRIPTGWVIDSLKPAGGVVRGDSVTWNLTTPFDYFEERQFFVWATLPRTTQLGSPYCVTLLARNQQGAAIGARSVKTDCGIVVGSYDPNDKLVKPEQMPPSYNPENELVYTIRFQNTGTYYAENVMILDTISSLLRLETFRLLNKSHNCEVKFKPGRIIEFQFNNIKLPETSRNEPASHGFVQFAMKPTANLPLNTSIGNKGYIYFDFNDPIITNTARTNVSVLGIEVSPEMRLSIAPNPATESCRVEFDTRGKLGTLTLTDALGRTVKSVELQGSGQHNFSVADMPAGLYYLRVNAEGQVLASGKLVIEK